MYQTPAYAKNDPEFIHRFIRRHPFAVMVSQGESLLATHIPVLINEDASELQLFSHIANHNEQFNTLKDGAEVLLIFSGAHGYISSSWYKEEDISTWNYEAVHVNATLKIQTQEELTESLQVLVNHFENRQEKPRLYEDISPDIIHSHLPRITGFWLDPVRIKAISKMSQNKPAGDVASILDHLEKEEGTEQLRQQINKENEKNDT